MHRLLALDTGAVLGWTVGELGDTMPVIGGLRLPTSSVRDLLGARADKLDLWLAELLRGWAPTILVLAERYRSRSLGEAATNFGLDGVVRMHAYRAGVEVLTQPENTVRKEILGRGSGPTELMKRLAIEWCHARGWPVADNHQADSAVLWHWAERELVQQSSIDVAIARPRRSTRTTRREIHGVTP